LFEAPANLEFEFGGELGEKIRYGEGLFNVDEEGKNVPEPRAEY